METPKKKKAKRKYTKKKRTPEQEKIYREQQAEKGRLRWKKHYEQKKAEELQKVQQESSQGKFKEVKVEVIYKQTPPQWRFSEAIKGGARVILFLGGIRA